MSIIAKLISVASKYLRGREVEIDSRIPDSYLISYALVRFMSLLRGMILCRRFVFLGKGVAVKCRRRVILGRGTFIGEYSKIDGLGQIGIVFGERVSIGSHSVISVSGSMSMIGVGITIHNDVALGDFCHIGGAGGVEIGRDTIVGAYFSVHPENHKFDDVNTLIRLQGVTHQGIDIGENCWIGAKVTVLDGAKIGSGCVVAAGSVVRGVFPNNVVIAGVPAKIIKRREDEQRS